MATAKSKLTTSPFMIRRVDVLAKLNKNKKWLEDGYKSTQTLREGRSVTRNGQLVGMNCDDAKKWLSSNWANVQVAFSNLKSSDAQLNYYTDYSDPDAVISFNLQMSEIPGFDSVQENPDVKLTNLNEAINPCFQQITDNRGNSKPSRYQQICGYATMLESNQDEWVDANLYANINNLITDFEQQFNTVGVIA